MTFGPAASAQPSQTCEFAVAGWLATQVELRDARRDYDACTEARTRACTAEQGRVRLLRERLRLVRNYLDSYCRR